MRSLFMQMLVVVLSICVGLLPINTSLVQAATVKDQQVAHGADENQKTQEKFEKAIEKLESYVVRNEDGTFSMKISKEEAQKSLGIAGNVYDRLHESMEMTNKEIRRGAYYSDQYKRVYIKGTTLPDN